MIDPAGALRTPREAAPVVEIIADTAPAPGDAPGVAPGALAGASLVVRVAPHAGLAGPATAREARVNVAIADPTLAQAITAAVAEALRGAVADSEPSARAAPAVRLRSRKRLARIAGQLAGAIAIVPVTARNARHLVELVDGIRAAGAIGVQLVWDGALPPRASAEHHVFAVLERARATPNDAPVVLATSEQPAAALHLLVAHRSPSTRRDELR